MKLPRSKNNLTPLGLSVLIGLGLGMTTATASATTKGADSAKKNNTDLLRFANNDTLHGTFLTFNEKGKLLWKSSEVAEPILFDSTKLHRIVINHSRAKQSISYKSAIHLTNGDIIPGTILSADQKSLEISTDHLGKVTIPLQNVRQIITTPFGGKLLYYGPLNQDGWEIIPFKKIVYPSAKDDEKGEKKETANDDEPSEKPVEKTSWKYIANSWYSGPEKKSYLVRKNALPDQCSLSFNVTWRGTLYADVILHADFAPPKYTGKGSPNLSVGTAGHAYRLTLSSHSASLTSVSFDKDGLPKLNRFNDSRPNLALNNKSSSHIEIRLDKTNKVILIYADGDYKGKWDLGDDYDGKGSDLAFSVPQYNKSQFRISEIAISQWNGMKDSAQSMSTKQRDVILLTNGIDRFSGTFHNIQNGKISFQGTFNNTLSIPIDDVQEIYLATNKEEPDKEKKISKDDVYFYIYPYGRISGTPSGLPEKEQHIIQIKSQLLNNIQLDTRYINLIDFSHKNSLLDLWDDNF